MKAVNARLPFHSLKAFILLGLTVLFLVGVVNATETADDADKGLITFSASNTIPAVNPSDIYSSFSTPELMEFRVSTRVGTVNPDNVDTNSSCEAVDPAVELALETVWSELSNASVEFVGEFSTSSSPKYTNNANLYKWEMSGPEKAYIEISDAGDLSGTYFIDEYWGEINQSSSDSDLYNRIYFETARFDVSVGGVALQISIESPRLNFASNIRSESLASVVGLEPDVDEMISIDVEYMCMDSTFSQSFMGMGSGATAEYFGILSAGTQQAFNTVWSELSNASVEFVGEFSTSSSPKYTNNANLYKWEMSGPEKAYIEISDAGDLSGTYFIDEYWGEINQSSSDSDLYNRIYFETVRFDVSVGGVALQISIESPKLNFSSNIRSESLVSVIGLEPDVDEMISIDVEYMVMDSTVRQSFLGMGGDATAKVLHDADGDGVTDAVDAFPSNASETVDSDGDGVGNNGDAFPNDASEASDSDEDGVGNNADTDDDGDSVLDGDDAFPLDATESVDTDSDGTGNNADTDDDGDSILDVNDAFPLDSTETVDTDGDDVGNNADLDDDGDGFSDAAEAEAGTDPLRNIDCSDCQPITVQISLADAMAPFFMADVELFSISAENESTMLESLDKSDTGIFEFSAKFAGRNRITVAREYNDSLDSAYITSYDALSAVKIAVGLNPNADPDGDGPLLAPEVSNEQIIAADINGDGKVTSYDALSILKAAVGLAASDALPRWVFSSDSEQQGESSSLSKVEVSWPETKAISFRAILLGDVDGNWLDSNVTDSDEDGVVDALDRFRFDSTETVDADNDGIGDNSDPDDDNDGVNDELDTFPLNSLESADNDLDGVGNNADRDDDGDGVLEYFNLTLFDNGLISSPWSSRWLGYEEFVASGESSYCGGGKDHPVGPDDCEKLSFDIVLDEVRGSVLEIEHAAFSGDGGSSIYITGGNEGFGGPTDLSDFEDGFIQFDIKVLEAKAEQTFFVGLYGLAVEGRVTGWAEFEAPKFGEWTTVTIPISAIRDQNGEYPYGGDLTEMYWPFMFNFWDGLDVNLRFQLDNISWESHDNGFDARGVPEDFYPLDSELSRDIAGELSGYWKILSIDGGTFSRISVGTRDLTVFQELGEQVYLFGDNSEFINFGEVFDTPEFDRSHFNDMPNGSNEKPDFDMSSCLDGDNNFPINRSNSWSLKSNQGSTYVGLSGSASIGLSSPGCHPGPIWHRIVYLTQGRLLLEGGNSESEMIYGYKPTLGHIMLQRVGSDGEAILVDADQDGVADFEDDLPYHSYSALDTDRDGLGNSIDTDDDNDGISDLQDALPLRWLGSDQDADGIDDSIDAFPGNSAEWSDFDGDGVGDNQDSTSVTVDALTGSWRLVHAFDSYFGQELMPLSLLTGNANLYSSCHIDDSYEFGSDGSFKNEHNGDAYIGPIGPMVFWTGQVPPESNCGAPVFPFDGSNDATYKIDSENQRLTLEGRGAYLGYPNIKNTGYLRSVADAVDILSYEVKYFDGDWMVLGIEPLIGDHWLFVLSRSGLLNDPDADSDSDGVKNSDDAFPLDPYETVDTDSDGVGNNNDDDDDGDGVIDSEDDFPLNPTLSINSLIGDWKLAPIAGALGVGPVQGETGWWSISESEVVASRACLFDDIYRFGADGSFANVMGDESWIETWQGTEADGCGALVAPHDGSNAATYVYDEAANTLTVDGMGAHIGLAKVYNGGELSSPNAAVTSIVYTITEMTDNSMTLDIEIAGGGYWRFKFVRIPDVDDDVAPSLKTAVNGQNWFHQTQLPDGGSWYNNEQQHYTDRLENSYVSDGSLNIVAKKESFTDQGVLKQYTSARLNSKYAFKYGRIEVRAKLPIGAGTWPAIWMLGKNIEEPGAYWQMQGFGGTPWPQAGELDIMEHWGDNQNWVSSAIHSPSSYGGTINHGEQYLDTASSAFHTYSLDWSAEEMIFAVDGVEHYRYNPDLKDANTWPFDSEMYLLLNVAVEPSISPDFVESAMEVDFVRVLDLGTGQTMWSDEFGANAIQASP